jgi:ubiquinone/menaquinone biosynthesis C-methylase UbiE
MNDEYALEAKFYDKIWGKYDYGTDAEFLDRLLREHRCRRVIDVGCGTGTHAIKLSDLGYKVTAVDVSSAMLKIARSKIKGRNVRLRQGDMKNLKSLFAEERFDAAISLGHVTYHLYTDQEVKVFFKGLHRILRKDGLLVFSARNAKKIKEEYLNTLRLAHIVNDEEIQILVLEHNQRDTKEPNTLVWTPIYLIKENDRVDLQIREHKLHWFHPQELRKLLTECGFKQISIRSGPSEEAFNEDLHADMWFVTIST